MIEILRSNDPVLISLVESLLSEADIGFFVADGFISAVEGSIGAFPRRVMVVDGDEQTARRILADAGLAAELRKSK